MRFAAPEFLALLWVLVALVVVRFIARVRRRRRAHTFSAEAIYPRLTPGLSGRRRGFRDALRLAAAAALVLALARPQFGQRLAIISREGIDVMVAVDTSASMLAEDLKPNRLETAKRAVVGLAERLRGDRLGVVVFSGSAFVQCPLTLDGKAVRLLIDAIGPEIVPDPGTAVGAAIDRATSAFASEERRFKALILFTDGEETAGDPIPAARRAADQGVRIFTVGLGAGRGEPIPVRNPKGAVVGYKKDRQGEVVVSRLDETTLMRLADIGDGRYFRATPALSELDALYSEIDNMEKREIRGGFHAHYEDRFHWFAVAAFVLLALARLIGERRPVASAVSALTAGLLLALAEPAAAAVGGVGSEVEKGNRAFDRGEPEVAAEHYLRALSEDPDHPEIHYNLGNALYVGERFTDAEAAYGTATPRADSSLAGPLSYNLGNALFRQQRYAEAAEAYKNVLRRDPTDEDARWNLELALRRLAQQEEERKEQKQDQDQDQQDQDQQDRDQQQQNQQQQEEEQEQDQEQDQDQQQQESQPEDQDQDQQDRQSDQQPEDGESPAGESSAEEQEMADEEQMTAEEAARLLDALGNDEQKLLRERFRARGRRVDVDKDW
jgi:Ca-activated chloride channel family protein